MSAVIEVLVVDDEVEISSLIAGCLKDEGFATRVAVDDKTTFAAIKQRLPNVIILDVWLEGSELDGLGILAGTYFGMGGSSSTFWYATTFGGTTIFRATSDGVYAQAISSPRAVQVNSNGTLGTVASTRRAKENIVPYSDPDNKILNVGAVTFDYKEEVIEEEDRANRFNQFGMIAEDLHDAGLNHLVHYDKDEQCSGINYQMLAVELLGVVKNLDARIKVLEGR